MANLLAEKQNVFWHDYDAIVCAGANAGIGLDALPPVREAIGSGFDTKTITLSCGKLPTTKAAPPKLSTANAHSLRQSAPANWAATFKMYSSHRLTCCEKMHRLPRASWRWRLSR